MALRFKVALRHTLHWIASDCDWVARLASREHVLLRYEQRFFKNHAVAAQRVQGLASSRDSRSGSGYEA